MGGAPATYRAGSATTNVLAFPSTLTPMAMSPPRSHASWRATASPSPLLPSRPMKLPAFAWRTRDEPGGAREGRELGRKYPSQTEREHELHEGYRERVAPATLAQLI